MVTEQNQNTEDLYQGQKKQIRDLLQSLGLNKSEIFPENISQSLNNPLYMFNSQLFKQELIDIVLYDEKVNNKVKENLLRKLPNFLRNDLAQGISDTFLSVDDEAAYEILRYMFNRLPIWFTDIVLLYNVNLTNLTEKIVDLLFKNNDDIFRYQLLAKLSETLGNKMAETIADRLQLNSELLKEQFTIVRKLYNAPWWYRLSPNFWWQRWKNFNKISDFFTKPPIILPKNWTVY